jgi:tetratricopeptide (TPR) repeat protein
MGIVYAVYYHKNNVTTWFQTASALQSSGQNMEAIVYADNALALDSRYEPAWVVKGAALANLNRNVEAVQCFQKAIEIDPASAKAWYGLAMCFLKEGRFAESSAAS